MELYDEDRRAAFVSDGWWTGVTWSGLVERWAREHMGPTALLRELRGELPKWWSWLPRLPGLMYETLQRAHDGELALEWKSAELARLRRQLEDSERRYQREEEGEPAGHCADTADATPRVRTRRSTS